MSISDNSKKERCSVPVMYFVVPCYNEEEIIKDTSSKLLLKLNELIQKETISSASRIVFVDDCSVDKTSEILKKLCHSHIQCQYLKLSHNSGQAKALLCGLRYAADLCDFAVTLDADLQDDISVLSEMIVRYECGFQIVYGVRNNRDTDTAFKKVTASLYYKFMRKLGTEFVYDHAEYRLMSKVVLQNLKLYNEQNISVRGICPVMGYKSDIVYYKRQLREAGASKYNVKSLVHLTLNNIINFSLKPISLKFYLSVFLLLCSLLCLACKVPFVTFQSTDTYYILFSIFFTGGLLMAGQYISGLYVGNTYFEVKNRPQYFVEEIIAENTEDFDKSNAAKESSDSTKSVKEMSFVEYCSSLGKNLEEPDIEEL